jgi:hypothetical protein
MDVGGAQVPCAISREALAELTGNRSFKDHAALASFETARGAIEALALRKFDAGGASITGVVQIWVSDLDEAPPRIQGTAARRAQGRPA